MENNTPSFNKITSTVKNAMSDARAIAKMNNECATNAHPGHYSVPAELLADPEIAKASHIYIDFVKIAEALCTDVHNIEYVEFDIDTDGYLQNIKFTFGHNVGMIYKTAITNISTRAYNKMEAEKEKDMDEIFNNPVIADEQKDEAFDKGLKETLDIAHRR